MLQRQRGYEWHLCNVVIQGPSTSSCRYREALGPLLCEKCVLQGGAAVQAGSHPVQSAIPQVPMKGCSWAEKKKGPNHATGRAESLLGLGLYFHVASCINTAFVGCILQLPQSPCPAWQQQLTKGRGLLRSYCFCRSLIWREVSEMLPRGPKRELRFIEMTFHFMGSKRKDMM